jgi:hypothetical protein
LINIQNAEKKLKGSKKVARNAGIDRSVDLLKAYGEFKSFIKVNKVILESKKESKSVKKNKKQKAVLKPAIVGQKSTHNIKYSQTP